MVPFGHLAEGNVHVNMLDAGDPRGDHGRGAHGGAGAGRHDLGRARRRHRQGPVAAPRAHPGRAGRRRRREARPRPDRHAQPRRARPPTRPDAAHLGRTPRISARHVSPDARSGGQLPACSRVRRRRRSVSRCSSTASARRSNVSSRTRRGAAADEPLDDVGVLEQAVDRGRQHVAGRPHRATGGPAHADLVARRRHAAQRRPRRRQVGGHRHLASRW